MIETVQQKLRHFKWNWYYFVWFIAAEKWTVVDMWTILLFTWVESYLRPITSNGSAKVSEPWNYSVLL